jgi:hypothetical protein
LAEVDPADAGDLARHYVELAARLSADDPASAPIEYAADEAVG